MKMQTFEKVPSDTKNDKRQIGDTVINVKGIPIRYGFYVRPNSFATTMNVSFIVAEDWRELQSAVISHFDFIEDDFPEETARKVFERIAVFGESEVFKANGKEYLVKR